MIEFATARETRVRVSHDGCQLIFKVGHGGGYSYGHDDGYHYDGDGHSTGFDFNIGAKYVTGSGSLDINAF